MARCWAGASHKPPETSLTTNPGRAQTACAEQSSDSGRAQEQQQLGSGHGPGAGRAVSALSANEEPKRACRSLLVDRGGVLGFVGRELGGTPTRRASVHWQLPCLAFWRATAAALAVSGPGSGCAWLPVRTASTLAKPRSGMQVSWPPVLFPFSLVRGAKDPDQQKHNPFRSGAAGRPESSMVGQRRPRTRSRRGGSIRYSFGGLRRRGYRHCRVRCAENPRAAGGRHPCAERNLRSGSASRKSRDTGAWASHSWPGTQGQSECSRLNLVSTRGSHQGRHGAGFLSWDGALGCNT